MSINLVVRRTGDAPSPTYGTAYTTLAEMLQRFGDDEITQLTDRALPTTGEVDTVVLNRAISDATGLVDSYLGARFVVPLVAPLPVDITRVASDIARYMLHDAAVPELVRLRYEDAVAWLRDVAMGKLQLVGYTGEVVNAKPNAAGPSAVAQYPSGAKFGASFSGAWLP